MNRRPDTAIARVSAHGFRWPVSTPVVTSFGTMLDRPALLVCVEDAAGWRGWGEVWCNFPTPGLEHRARLVDQCLAPWLLGRETDDPAGLWAQMTKAFHVLALQTGEFGPLAQVIAGIDTAVWDLDARRHALPLWRHLQARGGTAGGAGAASVPVYASGINPSAVDTAIPAARQRGFDRFKVKVGFGRESDLRSLSRATSLLAGGEYLAADANQGWTLEQALEMAPALQAFELAWLEEPLAADATAAQWHALRRVLRQRLAGGENLAGEAAFDEALAQGLFDVVQPDLAKWGGPSACWRVARKVVASGRTYCPHFLGAGVGLLASAHLLAAVGGDGWLEVDCNDNPLREAWCPPLAGLQQGRITLPDAPGLGPEPELGAFESWRVRH